MEYQTPKGNLTIETHCSPEAIQRSRLAEGLGIFWHGDLERQKTALVKIAGQPEGNVVTAHTDDGTIVGFLTILAPDPTERWGKDHIAGLLELGGIEVAQDWRGFGIARKLLEATFENGEYDECVVFATAYSWCWDLDRMGLSIAEYRKMLNTVFRPFGFEPYVTDEPNVRYYAGNALAARVGPKVPLKLFRQFLGLLVQDENRSEFLMW
jgi:acetoin utilization protein AcuA